VIITNLFIFGLNVYITLQEHSEYRNMPGNRRINHTGPNVQVWRGSGASRGNFVHVHV
jgi:hypothetical protein